ncbi:hypothetical protein M9458_007476, partial [Cirrhinus mrigala]
TNNMSAEAELMRLRQGGKRLDQYVGEFLELANQLSWHDAALGACFLMGLDEDIIRCDLPACDYSLIELVNVVFYLNGSDFEVEKIYQSRRPTPSEPHRVVSANTMPGNPTCCADDSDRLPRRKRTPLVQTSIHLPNPERPPAASSRTPPAARKKAVKKKRRQVTAAFTESSQVAAPFTEPSQVAAAFTEPSQVAAAFTVSSQVAAVFPESSQVSAVFPVSSQVTAVFPEPSQVRAVMPESSKVTAVSPELSLAAAVVPEPSQDTAVLHGPEPKLPPARPPEPELPPVMAKLGSSTKNKNRKQ